MIKLGSIPVDISPERLAAFADTSAAEARSFLDIVGPIPPPTGIFDEVEPVSFLKTVEGVDVSRWGSTVIAGLCASSSPNFWKNLPPGASKALWTIAGNIFLRDSLDFLEYRIRGYLKPTGRQPGAKLIPGCPDLPLAANKAIIDYFGPDDSSGLLVNDDGELSGPGLAFIYASSEAAPTESACDRCTRRDCPARA